MSRPNSLLCLAVFTLATVTAERAHAQQRGAPPHSGVQDICQLDRRTCPEQAWDQRRKDCLLQKRQLGAQVASQKPQSAELNAHITTQASDPISGEPRLGVGDLVYATTSFDYTYDRRFGLAVLTEIGLREPNDDSTLRSLDVSASRRLWRGTWATLGFRRAYALALVQPEPNLPGPERANTWRLGLHFNERPTEALEVSAGLSNQFTRFTGQSGDNEIGSLHEARFSTLFTLHQGLASAWLGGVYQLPWSQAEPEQTHRERLHVLPAPKVELYTGFAFEVSSQPSTQVFWQSSWIWRGSRDQSETVLPLYDGGYDQVRLTVGLRVHWEDFSYLRDPSLSTCPDPRSH